MTITLQAVNELIQSLESAGELSIREQKFLKLAKEFRICSASLDAAIKTGNMLADQNAQLAAENVGLKAGRKFFMYSDDSGFETFETQEEAIKAAHEMIDACREDAYDGWPEEADTIRWGVVIQQATETDFEKPAPENGWEGSSDYKLLPEVPATDRIVAGIKADGVEEFAVKLRIPGDDQFFDALAKGVALAADDFAKQLREGADK
ncbi:hypothetical protein [Klebsiella pneumoniae]|uniref:hypothetical protein n=1 Tax=Klebsiella pneumoniae TaxID=573 RepID=UPI003D2335C6